MTYTIVDNVDGSFSLTVDGVLNILQKSQVNYIKESENGTSVYIAMANGGFVIERWQDEDGLGAVSAADLVNLINAIVTTIP